MYKGLGSYYSHLPMIFLHSLLVQHFLPFGEFLFPHSPAMYSGRILYHNTWFSMPQEWACDTAAIVISPEDKHVTQDRPIRIFCRIF